MVSHGLKLASISQIFVKLSYGMIELGPELKKKRWIK